MTNSGVTRCSPCLDLTPLQFIQVTTCRDFHTTPAGLYPRPLFVLHRVHFRADIGMSVRCGLSMITLVGRGRTRGIVLYENQLPSPLAPVGLLPRCGLLLRRPPAPGR